MIDYTNFMSQSQHAGDAKGWLTIKNIGGFIANSGVNVTPDLAMQHTAIFACVQVLADSLAMLPLDLYRRYQKNGRQNKEKATDHRLYSLLHDTPNPELTSFAWRHSMMCMLGTRGNHYSQIVRDGAGRVIGLYPLLSDKMEVRRRHPSGRLAYLYTLDNGSVAALEPEEVLHIQGLTLDGVMGLNPIAYNRHTIGASMAMEEFGSTLFKNGATPSGVVSGEGVKSMSDTAFERFKESFKANFQGLMNAGKPLILEDGFKFTPITINNKDGQYLESRKFTKSEIASIYRVPLHMINDLDKATFSNIEHQSLEFVIHTIMPWAVRIEQALNKSLLSDTERSTYFIKFNISALLRGDMKTRFEAYGMAIKDGWMNRNEPRDLEDMNPADGLDEYLYPLNMAPVSETNTKGNL